MLHKLSKLFAIFAVVLAFGCAAPEKTADEDAAQMYRDAYDALQAKDYLRAVDLYSKLESRYPFSKYAQQAMFDGAYAYYKGGDAVSSISTIDRFIKLYPRHENVDYAYYLKGLVNFHRNDSFFDKFIETDKTSRDPKPANDALQTFAYLLEKYPTSVYITDAKAKINTLRQRLAAHEIQIAEYYAQRNAYVAVANRAAFVLEVYPETSAATKAKKLLKSAHKALKVN